MTEKKYYVGLKSLNDEGIITDFLWKDHQFYPCFEKSAYALTKKEISDIQDGTLYKQRVGFPFAGFYGTNESLEYSYGWSFNEELGLWEWTNPMIKLFPEIKTESEFQEFEQYIKEVE